MFDTIVVALDGTTHTEVAIPPALALATHGRAGLLFMSVATPDLVRQRDEYLCRWQLGLSIESETDVVVGASVPEGIIAAARAYESPLVCMTSHGRGPLGQTLFGSNSTRVIHEIGSPVLIAGPHCAAVTGYSDVVVAVDDSKESAAILPAAVALADKIDAKIQIVQVIDAADLRRAREAGVHWDDLRESGHVAKLARQLTREGVTCGWEVLHHREAAHGIVDYLHEFPSAVVAMATHARSGMGLLAHHGVASHVVHRSANPVLLLH